MSESARLNAGAGVELLSVVYMPSATFTYYLSMIHFLGQISNAARALL